MRRVFEETSWTRWCVLGALGGHQSGEPLPLPCCKTYFSSRSESDNAAKWNEKDENGPYASRKMNIEVAHYLEVDHAGRISDDDQDGRRYYRKQAKRKKKAENDKYKLWCWSSQR